MDSFTIFISIIAALIFFVTICTIICNCVIKVAQENADFDWPSDEIAQCITTIDVMEHISEDDKIELIKLIIANKKKLDKKVGFSKDET